MNKWWTYQKERCPVFENLTVSAVICFSTLFFAGFFEKIKFSFLPFLGVIMIAFCFFILIRIADEHKDYEEDCIENPERPVQRGLITLKELFKAGVFITVIQVILVLLINVKSMVFLGIVWGWFFLMIKEFFVRKWLVKHQIIYTILHIALIVPMNLFILSVFYENKTLGIFLNPNVIVFILLELSCLGIISITRELELPDKHKNNPQKVSLMRRLSAGAVLVTFLSALLSGYILKILNAPIYFYFIFLAAAIVLITVSIISHKKQTDKNFKIVQAASAFWALTSMMGSALVTFIK